MLFENIYTQLDIHKKQSFMVFLTLKSLSAIMNQEIKGASNNL